MSAALAVHRTRARPIEGLLKPLLDGDGKVVLAVTHIQWTESADLSVHLFKETVEVPQRQSDISIYAINIYRRTDNGWRLLAHQNSPTPPPPGAMPNVGS